jgi:hypothetical protein
MALSICNWPSLDAVQCEGYNTLLGPEEKKMLPKVSQIPTCIFGLDVSHGSPGDATSPSIAAVRTFVSRSCLEYQLELSWPLWGWSAFIWVIDASSFHTCFPPVLTSDSVGRLLHR